MKNIVFPASLVYFSHVGYKVVLYIVSVSGFGSCLLFLVLFVSILDILFVLFCECCLVFSLEKTRTKWFSCLHLVVFFPFCCVVLNLVFFFFFVSFLSKKDPQKTGHGKNPKNQKYRKNGQTKKIS